MSDLPADARLRRWGGISNARIELGGGLRGTLTGTIDLDESRVWIPIDARQGQAGKRRRLTGRTLEGRSGEDKAIRSLRPRGGGIAMLIQKSRDGGQ